jgi:hypothetical protein
MPEASCGSIGLAGSERMAVGAASFSSRGAGGSAAVGATASPAGSGGLVASDSGGMAERIGGDSSRSAGAAKEPWTSSDTTLGAAAASLPGVDETPAQETDSDPGGAPPIAEIGGCKRCEFGTPKKLNAKLKRPRARASAMKMMPTTRGVVPCFVLPENALSCLPILFFMSTGAVDRTVAWSEHSTARGPLSGVAVYSVRTAVSIGEDAVMSDRLIS